MNELIVLNGIAQGRMLIPAPHAIVVEMTEKKNTNAIQLYNPSVAPDTLLVGKVRIVGSHVCDDIQLDDIVYIRKADTEYQHNQIRIENKLYYIIEESLVCFLTR